MGDFAKSRDFAKANLVQDLSGLLVTPVIHAFSLMFRQEAERCVGDIWMQRQRLQ